MFFRKQASQLPMLGENPFLSHLRSLSLSAITCLSKIQGNTANDTSRLVISFHMIYNFLSIVTWNLAEYIIPVCVDYDMLDWLL